MPELKFDVEAMGAVKEVMKSCKILMPTMLTENQKYFLELLEKGKSVSTREFLEKLPDKENDKLFGDLFDFAKSFVSGTISKRMVWIYFAGPRHIKKSSEDISQMEVSGNTSYQLQIGHMLLPVKAVVISSNKINALYENDGKKVLIKNIQQGELKGKIRLREYVLVHYASILEVNPDTSLIEMILKDQARNKHFMAICEATDIIDYEKLTAKLCA